ncbi:NmrA family transcriptional regulator [Pseudonocardia sp.]|uniref:NmrA family transcriptional regulator n=1 Tax=Pseudonocardia sp. TaxID=60912 RepID=UPI003D14AA76
MEPVLVIGPHGTTGSRVVERLRRLDIGVRGVSRSTPVPFDWERPATWPGALRGVRTAYITYHPDLSFPGAAARVGALAREAASQGVERAVLLTGRGEEGALASEDALLEALPRSTALRCAFFAQNFTEGALRDAVAEGVIAMPVAPDIVEPFLDAGDIADVAVAALTRPGHEAAVYELTGPRSMTFAEAADVLGEAAGRPVAFAPVTPAEWVAGAVASGLPEPFAAALADLFGEIFDGRNVATSDGVQRVLGRPATGLAESSRAIRTAPRA